MMNDEDLERLLKAMPLRKAEHLPETLAAGGFRKRGIVRILRRTAAFRIPIWQAAAAAVLAVAAYAFFASLKPGELRDGTRRLIPPGVARAGAPEIGGEETQMAKESQADFWRLPARYAEMAKAAAARNGGMMGFHYDERIKQ